MIFSRISHFENIQVSREVDAGGGFRRASREARRLPVPPPAPRAAGSGDEGGWRRVLGSRLPRTEAQPDSRVDRKDLLSARAGSSLSLLAGDPRSPARTHSLAHTHLSRVFSSLEGGQPARVPSKGRKSRSGLPSRRTRLPGTLLSCFLVFNAGQAPLRPGFPRSLARRAKLREKEDSRESSFSVRFLKHTGGEPGKKRILENSLLFSCSRGAKLGFSRIPAFLRISGKTRGGQGQGPWPCLPALF